MVTSLEDLNIGDSDDDMDDEALQCTSAFMVSSRLSIDPPAQMEQKESSDIPKDSSDDTIEVKAHVEYSIYTAFQNKTYAIADGGADACILGKYAKVISYTGRYANLVGYDPNTTRTEKVPIVSAYIKAISSSIGNHPVLLNINEAPYNSNSPITLLSEYQIREYNLVIDSVAKKHKSSYHGHGTQCFHVNSWVYINFEDRGGLMGFEILPIEEGDETKFDIITITSPLRWTPTNFSPILSLIITSMTLLTPLPNLIWS